MVFFVYLDIMVGCVITPQTALLAAGAANMLSLLKLAVIMVYRNF